MSKNGTQIRIEVDRETDHEFSQWSDAEGRSKRRHVEILMRKLASLRKSHPEDLQRLGLVDRQCA
jgi:uncharacterized sporulation protein YeaH/YhbH (DUF444 family)